MQGFEMIHIQFFLLLPFTSFLLEMIDRSNGKEKNKHLSARENEGEKILEKRRKHENESTWERMKQNVKEEQGRRHKRIKIIPRIKTID